MLINRNNVSVGVSHLPDRKLPVLVVMADNTIIKVATFNGEETAKFYERAMEKLLDGLIKEQEHE